MRKESEQHSRADAGVRSKPCGGLPQGLLWGFDHCLAQGGDHSLDPFPLSIPLIHFP
jgi:hypothetical protein